MILGAIIQGFTVDGRHFTGTSLDCFTPFTTLTGLSLVAGYALLGAGWLVIKTESRLQDWARALGRRFLIATVLAIVAVSAWTPAIDPLIWTRWFSWPNIAFLAPIPLITAALIAFEWRALSGNSHFAPFFGALALFVMSYLGIGISRYPMIVPGHFSLDQAAAAPSTQAFLLLGTLFLLPVILIYTAWSYWVFRGKVTADSGYH